MRSFGLLLAFLQCQTAHGLLWGIQWPWITYTVQDVFDDAKTTIHFQGVMLSAQNEFDMKDIMLGGAIPSVDKTKCVPFPIEVTHGNGERATVSAVEDASTLEGGCQAVDPAKTASSEGNTEVPGSKPAQPLAEQSITISNFEKNFALQVSDVL